MVDDNLYIRLLLPVGSHVILNPLKLKEGGLSLGILNSKGNKIVDLDYNHPVAYSDNHVSAMVLSYEDDVNDNNIIYMSLLPDEKEDTILFVRMPKLYKGPLQFLTLLDSDYP